MISPIISIEENIQVGQPLLITFSVKMRKDPVDAFWSKDGSAQVTNPVGVRVRFNFFKGNCPLPHL